MTTQNNERNWVRIKDLKDKDGNFIHCNLKFKTVMELMEHVCKKHQDTIFLHIDCRYKQDQERKRVAVYCENCQMILDEGQIDDDSSLLLWNDFTTIEKHLHHTIILRLKTNCPITIRGNSP